MATEIRLPGLGESIAEGTIVRWLKQVGESVERDEDLVLVATDKIETEVPSSDGGVVLALLTEVGQTVAVGSVIAILGEEGESWEPPAAAEVSVSSPPPPAVAAPARGSASTSTPSVAVAAPVDPARRNQQFRAGGDRKLFVSPVVRRIAREQDVDLSLVLGSGAGGRVTRRDIEAFVARGGGGSGFASPPGGYQPGQRIPPTGFAQRLAVPFDPAVATRFAPEVFEGDTIEALSPIGRAMAQHMAYTWWRAPHVSTLVEVDMKRVAASRVARGDVSGGGSKPSYTAFVCHAVAQALTRHRGFNSSLTHDLRRVSHAPVNLGVAVARADGGLVVPVIHGADAMSLDELAAALNDRVDAAREGRLTAADLTGGTFTITNVGSNGNLASQPLINQPQVAILAMGVVRKRVVVVTDDKGKDAMGIRPMMFLTLCYDHRANDGAASGRFLRDLRKGLELWQDEH